MFPAFFFFSLGTYFGHANQYPSVKNLLDAPQLIIFRQISWDPLNNY